MKALETPDRLAGEPAYLGDVAPDRQNLRPQALLDGFPDAVRHSRLELGRASCKLVERFAGSCESSLESGRLGTARARFREACPCPVERLPIHAGDCSVGIGLNDEGELAAMRTEELDYDLPPELIAQQPLDRRDESRLLVYERSTGDVRHRVFRELPTELARGELVVVNDTRVVPARIQTHRPGGGKAEILLLEPLGEGIWEALARPSRKLRPGMKLEPVELLEALGEGRWLLRLEGEADGEAPLPPYIVERLADPERYQTVYGQALGSAAAPTAGLHFTPELLARFDCERVTLHVGLDTFRPIATESLAEHLIHSERYEVDAAAWGRILAAERVCAVGTTTVRVLESLARGAELVGRTNLFVTPGFEFSRVDALVTNFHLPRSSLLALVMAFAGVEETRKLYDLAIAERYRFYSFGDAMLVL